MSCILTIFLILFGSSVSLAYQDHDDCYLRKKDEDNFFKTCPPTTCGSGPGSLQIRYPFRLQSAPASCGLPDLHLICSGNDTLLTLPSLPPIKVTAIDYIGSSISIRIGSGFGSLSTSCPLKNLSSLGLLNTPKYYTDSIYIVLFSCSRKLDLSSDSSNFAGPILCLSRSGYFVYAVDGNDQIGVIPSGCVVVEGGGVVPISTYDYGRSLEENLGTFLERREVVLSLHDYIWRCRDCEEQGKFCGYSWERNDTFCYSPSRNDTFCYSPSSHGSRVMLIAGLEEEFEEEPLQDPEYLQDPANHP